MMDYFRFFTFISFRQSNRVFCVRVVVLCIYFYFVLFMQFIVHVCTLYDDKLLTFKVVFVLSSHKNQYI